MIFGRKKAFKAAVQVDEHALAIEQSGNLKMNVRNFIIHARIDGADPARSRNWLLRRDVDLKSDVLDASEIMSVINQAKKDNINVAKMVRPMNFKKELAPVSYEESGKLSVLPLGFELPKDSPVVMNEFAARVSGLSLLGKDETRINNIDGIENPRLRELALRLEEENRVNIQTQEVEERNRKESARSDRAYDGKKGAVIVRKSGDPRALQMLDTFQHSVSGEEVEIVAENKSSAPDIDNGHCVKSIFDFDSVP